MTATLFSLITVTAGFILLVAWVYWPSRRTKLEALGQIPFEDKHPDIGRSQRSSAKGRETNSAMERPNE